MVLINLTVKTIEGRDNQVSVDNKMLLAAFRDVVKDATSIEKDRQRIIFRGRVMTDEDKSLESYGLETGYAIHVVNRPLPTPATAASTEDASAESSNNAFPPLHTRVRNQSLIVGNVPIERTDVPLFEDPQRLLALVREQFEQQLGTTFSIDSDVRVEENRQSEGDLIVDVLLVGRREPFVLSPARECFQHCAREVKKLGWMIATVKALFNRHIDSLLNAQAGSAEPEQAEAYERLAFILRGMQTLDHFQEEQLRASILFANGIGVEEPLLSTIEELRDWQFPDDEAHSQPLEENGLVMRHCTSADYARLHEFLAVVESHFNEHLMARYLRTLNLQQDHENSSYAARLLNCFGTAVSRIQHRRAHLYHVMSDFGLHFDSNPHRRLFPQFIVFERDEPPRANINFVFTRPPPTAANPNMRQTEETATPTSTQQGAASGARSPLSPFAAVFPHMPNISQRPDAAASSPLAAGGARATPNPLMGALPNFLSQLFGQATPSPTPPTPQASAIPALRQLFAPQAPPGVPSGWVLPGISQPPFNTGGMNRRPAPSPPQFPAAQTSRMAHTSRQENDRPPSTARNVMVRTIPNRPIQVARRRIVANGGPAASVTAARANYGLVGWRQLPAESPGAIFIGPRPPTTIPIYTADVHLPCSSHRLTPFEMDSRHADFWNDPITVASGLHPQDHRHAPLPPVERMDHDGDEGATSVAESSGVQPASALGGTRSSPLRVTLNANGEAVFTDEADLTAYIRHVAESVISSMVEVQPRLALRQYSTSPPVIYGFAPIIGGPAPQTITHMPARTMRTPVNPVMEGTISIVAEIPLNPSQAPPPRPTANEERGGPSGGGGLPSGMEEPPFD